MTAQEARELLAERGVTTIYKGTDMKTPVPISDWPDSMVVGIAKAHKKFFAPGATKPREKTFLENLLLTLGLARSLAIIFWRRNFNGSR